MLGRLQRVALLLQQPVVISAAHTVAIITHFMHLSPSTSCRSVVSELSLLNLWTPLGLQAPSNVVGAHQMLRDAYFSHFCSTTHDMVLMCALSDGCACNLPSQGASAVGLTYVRKIAWMRVCNDWPGKPE